MKSRGRGITLSYVYTFLNMILGLFLSTFLLRTLGDTEYGVYQAISSFVNYLILFEFGTGTVMVKNISVCRAKGSDDTEIDKNISTIWVITNILAVLIATFSVIFFCSIERIYHVSMSVQQMKDAKIMFAFMIITLIAAFYVQTLNGITLGFEKYTYSTKQKIVKLLLRTVALALAVYFLRNAIVVAAIDAVINVIILICAFWFVKRKLKVRFDFMKFDKKVFVDILPLCMALFLQTIISQANNNVDKFLIGVMMTPEFVSVYSISLYIFGMFTSLINIPISFYAPQVAKEITAGIALDQIHTGLILPCRLTVLVGGSILFGFVAAGEQFVAIIYGREYLIAWVIAIIIMTPMFLNMITGVLINVLDVLNKRLVRSCILLFTTLANIALTVVWLQKWGIIGAAAATAVCTLIGNVFIINLYYGKVLGIKVLEIYKKAMNGIVVFQVIGSVAALALKHLIDHVYISFLVCGITYVIVFACGYLKFGIKEEKTLIHKLLWKKIKRKEIKV